MKSFLLKIILAFAAFAILVFVLYFLSPSKIKVCFKNNCFDAIVAKTDNDRKKGLMNVKEMKDTDAMLFVFNETNYYPFWMKNTFIPLDIIWLDENKKVVFIKENALPCQEYCPQIMPESAALYVLEINGGLSQKIKIEKGSLFEF